MARNKRAIPEINAGSMADIAFLLLIFFLVTTTMDVDKGITRKLPPIEDNSNPPPINERNIFTIVINASNQILVEDEYMEIDGLRKAALEFLDNNGDKSCSYCEGAQDPKSSENPKKAVISLQNDRGTSYQAFLAVQNELTAAYNELRNRLSKRQFGRSFDNLNEEETKVVMEAYPMIISEAEPLKLGS